MVLLPDPDRPTRPITLPGVTAKDLMLYILLVFAKSQQTLNRVMEFTGPGVTSLSMDERATLANMATECTARSGIVIADEETWRWLREWRGSTEAEIDEMKANAVEPDPGAQYAGGIHTIDLSTLEPMVADPGNPDQGIASDPTNGAKVKDIGTIKIDIAYAGSCTAGKIDDLIFYHQVCKEAVDAGLKVAEGVDFIIQCGSMEVENYCRQHGFFETFKQAGVRIIHPGCGACIGCGPGVSETEHQVTVSAINRNYKGRSGPGQLWLASPLTVAASAFTGKIFTRTGGTYCSRIIFTCSTTPRRPPPCGCA